MEIANQIKLLMQKRGIKTASELSRRANGDLTPVAIRNFLRGAQKPNLDSIIILAKALDTSTDYLIMGREQKIEPANDRKKRNILFVDDDLAAVKPYIEVLKAEHYNVVLVSSAFEALQKLREQEFELGIFDIFLNGHEGPDGLFLLYFIKSRMSDFPVIMTSESPSTKVIKTAYELGARTFLEKPITLNEMVDAVNKSMAPWVKSHPIFFQENPIYDLSKNPVKKDNPPRETRENILSHEDANTHSEEYVLT